MKKLGNKIAKILDVDPDNFAVQIRFKDRKQAWISLSDIFNKPKGLAAEVLRGKLFRSCFIENGALAWPNGLELCPDSLKMKIKSQKKRSHS